MQRTLWNGFKNFAILFSFVLNFVLLVVVLILGIHLFDITDGILEPLVDGLHENFIALDEANIIRQIAVQDEIPVAFTLNLVDHPIRATISQDVPLTRPATFNLPGGGGIINGTVDLTLPAGLELPLTIFMDVPVDENVAVDLLVDVEIPLDETQLHQPFYNLRMLFEPLVELIDTIPNDWPDAVDTVLGRDSAE